MAAPPTFLRPRVPPLTLFTDALFGLHETPADHPERPERIAAARRGLERADLALDVRPTSSATDEQLLRVHPASYLAHLRAELGAGTGRLDEDTFYGPHTRDAAWHAAGGACGLVDALLENPASPALLLARPPGHHATASQAMGFCFLNNVAVAAAHARSRGAERVAIVDWDVHHGNGTQELFWNDPSVLFLSLHQYPLYPGTGAVGEIGGEGALGRTVNVPLAAGADGAVYARAFERVVLPVLRAFAPDLVLVSAGFDAHARDPLAEMALDGPTYGWMAARLRALSLELGHGRIGVLLEGGYDLVALEESLREVALGLTRPARYAMAPKQDPQLRDDFLRAVLMAQRVHWPGAL